MPYPWRSRSDSVRRINMSSEPGNESFLCALRPIPRILSLRRRDYASQVQIGEPSRRKKISGCSRAADANHYGGRCRCRQRTTSDLNGRKASERSVRVVGNPYLGITSGLLVTRSKSRCSFFVVSVPVFQQLSLPTILLEAKQGWVVACIGG